MSKIKINKEQISELIKNGNIELPEDKLIEFRNANLVLNDNGYIHYAEKLHIEFKNAEIENKHAIDFVQDLVCRHLNLTPCNVIFNLYSDGEFEFTIRFNKNIENQMIICDFNRAKANTQSLDIPIDNGREQIGMYKRLEQSAYYFRWIENL